MTGPAESIRRKRAEEATWGKTLRAYTDENDVYRIDHSVQVTSFGGSGTTALCKHLVSLGVDLQKGPAQWPFKHRRIPPTADEVPDGFRVVYLLGDPRDAVLSVFRRDLQIGHFVALNDQDPEPDAEARLAELDGFLAAGIDDFALAAHVEGWRNHPPGYPVMFVRYEYLGEVWNRLASFLGLAQDAPALPVQPRSSDWSSEPDAVRIPLEAMYGELARSIQSRPPIEVI